MTPKPLPPELAAMADKIDQEAASLTPPPVIPSKEYGRLIPVLSQAAPLLGVAAPVEPQTEEKMIDMQPDAWGILQTLVAAAEAYGADLEIPSSPSGMIDRSEILFLIGQIQALLNDKKFIAFLKQPETPQVAPKQPVMEESMPESDDSEALFASRV